MKKKTKDIIYIPGQDMWSEHFPTPGKLRPSNFGHMFCEPNSQYNKLLRTQNKLKTEKEMITIYHILKAIGAIYITYQLIQNEKRYTKYKESHHPTKRRKYIFILEQILWILNLIAYYIILHIIQYHYPTKQIKTKS